MTSEAHLPSLFSFPARELGAKRKAGWKRNRFYSSVYSVPSISYTLSYDSTTFELNGTVSVGKYTGNSLINALNAATDYYFLRDYSKWLLNKESKTVNFIINSRTSPITMDTQVILLPSLVDEGNITFDGWYTDNGYTDLFESFEVTENKTLYGRFEENNNNYTISFDTRGGRYVAPITAKFGAIVLLPSDLVRQHCNVAFWETEYGDYVGLNLTMPAHNFTLYTVWKCTHIATPEDFIDFSKTVNSGADDFNGTTVYLNSDLSFFGKTFEPVGGCSGYYATCQFIGVFDGQGHIINNLQISSSTSKYTGLFGHSRGLTIRNVVLDSSCSITSSYSGSEHASIGGIIGECNGGSGECNIGNSVNMAGVAFGGYTHPLYLGGIAGYLSSSSYVKNCANYGSVTHSGNSDYSYIGGIVGYLFGSSSKDIQNSLNYGIIAHNGASSNTLYIGGIAGRSYYAYIENSVSAGGITIQNTPWRNCIGSIVGSVYSNTSITRCYYTNDVGIKNIYGDGIPSSETETPHSSSAVNLALTTNLNNYTSKNDTWNKWLFNENNAYVTFKMSNNVSFSLSSNLIILPNLTSDWRCFIWFTDETMATPFSSLSVSSNTTLYGRWDKYAVEFDANGGNTSEISRGVAYNSTYGELPDAERTGYSFLGWFAEKTGGSEVTPSTTFTSLSGVTLYAHWVINNYTVTFVFNNGAEDEVRVFKFNAFIAYPADPMKREGYTFKGWDETVVHMPAHNITITALWSANNYTVSFDVNGGNNLDNCTKTATFNSSYGPLPTPTKEGHMFLGWFTDSNVSIKNETAVIIADNHTLHAHWEKTTNQVEIVFNTKDLSREDIEEIVKKYTDAKFTITGFERESGEIRVIIKFADNKKAESFVENIRESSEMNDVKKVSFVSGHDAPSISSMLYPILFFSIIFFIV